ncbi:pyridoxine 5'-phosphate synthase [Anaplasma platys]|uniref:Pyridoxine 5'-phosphate synthase n=1 Tax=Anaplasma platys TaxID=949 RepID=A0A858PYM8_9RICK|nr:pyridoxine 5'-phosphate synthase [Anaplasma platys]QJC27670.1 pyridoxine 5'-phosphate synthase [Anaplasma platys]
MKLGVNVDHVATLRNLRGTAYPCILSAARTAMQAGAAFITVHLREDRRHVRDADLAVLTHDPGLPINLEMAATEEMAGIALAYRPPTVCLVPEKRNEVTTESGLDVVTQSEELQAYIAKLHAAGIRVTLFVEPLEEQIVKAAELKADTVELHVGEYCRTRSAAALKQITTAAATATRRGIECHAGHGIDQEAAKALASVPGVSALNVGHFVICDAIQNGLAEAVSKMINIIQQSR